MTKNEVMQMALDALEDVDGIDTETECVTIDVGEAIEALRAALAQPEHWSDCAVHNEPAYPAGECDCKLPVAWWNKIKNAVSTDPYYRKDKECIPLYTALPQREWVGLTDEEIKRYKPVCADFESFRAGVKAVEIKIKGKNGF